VRERTGWKDEGGGDDVGRATLIPKEEERVCMYVCVSERV